LDQAEQQAFAHSPILKAAESNLSSAVDLIDVQFAQMMPRLTADGSYQVQSEVPNFSFVPGRPGVPFGDYKEYSVGPTLAFTLWDQGSLWKAWKSQKAVARSQRAQRDLVTRQVLLMTRLDYFQVQLSLEQERSLLDSLRLADVQYRDIDKRYRAGATSQIDWLSAHQQVLDRRRDLRSAEATVAASLRALFAQTGQNQNVNLSHPLDARIEDPLPTGVVRPTVWVALEPLISVQSRLEPAATAPVDTAYPLLIAYREQAESQRLSAASISAGQWPRIQFTGRSFYEYPNLPLLQSTWQNTALVTAGVPLFEFSRTKKQAKAVAALAQASEHQKDEAFDELLRDWNKARDQFAALKDQSAIDRESVAETKKLVRLRYSSYRNGGSTILDVQAANLSAVQARILAAQTQTQMLIQLATLDSLSKVTHEQ
jgi:outer membrane protein TolC